jgi:hypothetical protein
MASKKPVAKPTPTPPPAAPPEDLGLFSVNDAADFYEGIDQGAYSVPFLSVLQALSPAVQRGGPGYIANAQPGMILNTVTRKTMDKVHVTVVRRSHSLCYWTPRDKGGGFLREEEAHADNMMTFSKIVPDDKGRRINGKGEEVTEHRNFWCVLFAEESKTEPALISMSKSQLKVARDWNTNIDVESAKIEVPVKDGAGNVIRAKRPILHSGIWELGTILRTKNENTWFAWTVRFLALHSDRQTLQLVRDKVELAKSQTNVNRQLEHIVDPTEQEAGDM